MPSHDPQAIVDMLTADLEPDAALELATELLHMIELGVLDLGAGDLGTARIAIAEPSPDLDAAA